MTATRSRLDQALLLAARGYPVHPLHHVEKGMCSCGDDPCKGKPGKHPRLPEYQKKASTDPATIRTWWTRWPEANIGIVAELAGVVVVGPDCETRHADFTERNERTGSPAPGLIVRSGSGGSNEHWYYRRPADCPITKINRPADFDILAIGNIVAPSSVTTGEYIALGEIPHVSELPELPAWAVAMLRSVREEKVQKEARALTLSSEASDAPPVALAGLALDLWHGRRTPADRSGTLWAIAKELYRAGLTNPQYIAMALQERDSSLSMGKYTERSDGTSRALSDALNAIADVELERTQAKTFAQTIPQPSPSLTHDDSACQVQVMRLKAKVDQLEAELAQVREHQSLTAGVLQNPDLTAGEKLTLLAVAFRVTQKAEQQKAKQKANDPDSDGWVKVSLAEIAKQATCSAATASRHIEKAKEWNLLDKDVGHVWKPERVNPETGEILPAGYVSELRVKLAKPTCDTLRELATITPTRVDRDGRTRTWGGNRTRCEKHRDADVLVTIECAECGEILVDRERRSQEPTQDPVFVDDTGNCKMQSGGDTRDQKEPPSGYVLIDEHLAITYPDAENTHCSQCFRPLRNGNERRVGRHSYDCTTTNSTPSPAPARESKPLFAGGDD